MSYVAFALNPMFPAKAVLFTCLAMIAVLALIYLVLEVQNHFKTKKLMLARVKSQPRKKQ